MEAELLPREQRDHDGAVGGNREPEHGVHHQTHAGIEPGASTGSSVRGEKP